ncbi:MAG: DUF5678 domain-containing protein [Acidobacteriota bacterium]
MSASATQTTPVEDLTVESILKQIRQLPRVEQLRVAQFVKEEQFTLGKAPLDKRVPAKPMPNRERERKWAHEHKHEYPGQWVAIDGDRLIAASPIQQEVWDAVDVDGATLPLVLRIPSPDDLPYVGI